MLALVGLCFKPLPPSSPRPKKKVSLKGAGADKNEGGVGRDPLPTPKHVGLTFRNVKNDAGASTKAQYSPCFFEASQAFNWLKRSRWVLCRFLLPSCFVSRRVSMPCGRWVSTKICRERCGSKSCVVHVLHRCSGLAIRPHPPPPPRNVYDNWPSQMWRTTTGQTQKHNIVGRGSKHNPTDTKNVDTKLTQRF